MPVTVSLTDQQLATARAALRQWLQDLAKGGYNPPNSVEFNKVAPLSYNEAMALLEQLQPGLEQRPKHQLKAPNRYRIVFTAQGTINGSAEVIVYAPGAEAAKRLAEDVLRDNGGNWSYDPTALPDFDETSAQVESVEALP